jgi:uncharacterized protein (DUF1499 family)
MKILGFVLLVLAVAGAGGFFLLAQKSKAGTAPGLVEGKLAPCPSSPNCFSSEEGTDEKHRTSPLPLTSWDRLPDIVNAFGGRIVSQRDDYMAAEFSTKIMGFVDDVEFRKDEADVHVRSASRVGYGDMGANRKRIIMLQAALMFSAGPCDESNRSVQRMRSLSQEQLSDLYRAVMGLREQYQYKNLTQDSDPPIPDDLAYLEAWYINVRGPAHDVLVVLDKCNVSVGVTLTFRSADPGPKMIELRWDEGTAEKPYASGSEILWSE